MMFYYCTLGGSSKSAQFDREQAAKIAPGYNLAQEDVLIKHLQAEEGLHGLGYQVGNIFV